METIQDTCEMDDVNMWDVMNEMRASDMLCDTTIVSSDGVQFSAHRIVLAACSPFFHDLFLTGNCQNVGEYGSKTDHQTITLSMDAEVIGAVLDYMYTQQPSDKTTLNNIRGIFEAADKFRMPDLMSECVSFIKCHLNVDNCLNVFEYATIHNLAELRHSCKTFMLKNFHELVSQGDIIRQIAFADIKEIISDDRLNMRSEEELFDSVMDWVSQKPNQRNVFIVALLKQVRLGLIEADYFVQKVTTHPYIVKNESACRATLKAAWDYICTQENNGSRQLHMKHTVVRPRIPHSVIFILGGWSGGTPISTIEVYDSRADKWHCQPSITNGSPRAYHGLVALNNKMYLIGGFDGGSYFNSLTCFDPVMAKWTEVAPMYNKRCYVSVATCGGCIYACGGFDGRVRLRSAECYHPTTNQWVKLPNMTYRRSDAGAASLNGKVYIAGGFNGDNCLRTVEVYDDSVEQWSEITSTISVRSGLCLSAYKSNIYAIGGFDGERRLRSVERYNELNNRWEAVAKMHLTRSNFTSAVMDDRLFVIGGFNGSRTIRNAEYFDKEMNEWHDINNINVNRSAFQACVLSDIPNITDYTFHGQHRG